MTASREAGGIDAETVRLYRTVVESPVHGPFIRRIGELYDAEPAALPATWPADVTLAVVPGVFYRENPRSGADGRLFREQAERLGCPTDLVPLASTGTLRQNAEILRDWLARQPERRIVLASMSKGGADVKTALAAPGAEQAFANVVGWINLCGILRGTPMTEWLLSRHPGAVLNRLYHRLRGWSLGFLEELRYGPGTPLDFDLNLPPHIRMVSVIGFPLREHLHRGISRRCHRRLTPLGPNDGGVVLADVCALPGLVYPLWGADHYLQPRDTDVRELVRALLQYMAETLRP